MTQEIIRIDLDGVNCYLGKQGENFILFDTAGHLIFDKLFDNRRTQLEKELDKAGCTPDNLKLIILTHGDNDHAANAAYFRTKYQTKIAMHQNDLENVENPTIETIMRNFKFRSLIYRSLSKLIHSKILKSMHKTLLDFESFKPDILVNEDFCLSEYGFDAKILHIPGHTSGSIGILTSAGDLISGDIFANNKKPEPAPNAIDFNEMHNSIKKLSAMNIRTVYPGHGNPFQMEEFSGKYI